MNLPAWANIAYLVASVLFIIGIKGMTHPRTAVRGNLISALSMLIAVVVTLSSGAAGGVKLQWWVIIVGLIAGSGIGAVLAIRVQMTGMPQLVAAFNGFGGLASTFVAWAELVAHAQSSSNDALISAGLAGLIGTVTFTGSFVAYGKLQGFKKIEGNVALPMGQLLNALLFLATLGLTAWIVVSPGFSPWIFLVLVILAAVLGITITLPIGGADMPVVIALLNSYSGLAAAATGFVIYNNVLIIAGSLVGASGLILTAIMCKAMNRSLTNVIFGKIDASSSISADDIYAGKIKSTSADELAMMLDGAQRVVIVPGYGMAVAQAQHAVRDLYQLLESKGVHVEFAIHPVAGRMPGHMNVLLAEVNIPYDRLIEAEAINPTLETADMAIVLGANDVVNPDARREGSPIAGMPIIDVDKANTVVVIKRSLSSGFAGIANPLFAMDNTLMYFADGKKAIVDLVAAIKEG